MSVSRIAARYAKPILELAEQKKVLEAVKEDMEGFVALCEQSRDFVLMLKSPIIPHLTKASILRKAFEGKVNDLTLQSFDLITRKNREAFLEDVAKEFLLQYNVRNGLQNVSVTSSIKLDADHMKGFEEIARKITGKTPVMHHNVDPDIIGGYIIKAGDKQIDQSVSGQLKNIKLKLQTK